MDILKLIGYIVLALFILSFLLPKQSNTLHGSARFEKSKDLRRWHKGFWIDRKRIKVKLSYQGLLVLGSTGQGKTQNIIAKNIFFLAEKHSLVILDPKAELLNISSGYIKNKLGASVYILNLVSPEKSIQWNCFAGCKIKDLQGLMTTLYDITNKENPSEAIWRFSAIEIMTHVAKVLHVYEHGNYLTLANLLHVINNLQVPSPELKAWLQQYAPDPETDLFFTRHFSTDDKLRHSMLAGAVSAVIPYCSEPIKQITGGHSLPDLKQFRKQKSVLYIRTALGQDSSFSPFVTLFLSQFLGQVIKDEVEDTDLSLALILEEFGNLGHAIPNFETIISTVRDKRTMNLVCVQNLEQIRDVYGDKKAETIMSNCSSWVVFPAIKSQQTLSYITNSLVGKGTVTRPSKEHTSSLHVARPLMTPDEVRRMKSDTGLFISGNNQPVRIRFRALYRSWYLKWRYGLKSKKGRLVSKYAPVEHTAQQEPIQYVSFDVEEPLDIEQQRFETLLKKHFPDTPA